jgi:N-hydroxyarylamine O-acetyltransferase
MDADSYLRRIGLDPVDIDALDRDSLARLQRAHVRTVPFENLSIAGDPWDRRPGEGISLSMADLEAKVVERERGGFCYELNGLFTELLDQVGFEATRNAGRIVVDGGIELPASPLDSLRSSRSLADFPLTPFAGIPANHLVPTVELDRTYVADVGMGTPKIRRPVPLDGTPVEDGVGNTWRVVENDRPDVDYTIEYRDSDEDPWTDRFVFTHEPKPMRYFTATCEYLTSAPESVFTGSTVVTIATEGGQAKLTGRELHRTERGEETVRTLDRDEWDDILAAEFGIEW